MLVIHLCRLRMIGIQTFKPLEWTLLFSSKNTGSFMCVFLFRTTATLKKIIFFILKGKELLKYKLNKDSRSIF
jgi:hypothetical protein